MGVHMPIQASRRWGRSRPRPQVPRSRARMPLPIRFALVSVPALRSRRSMFSVSRSLRCAPSSCACTKALTMSSRGAANRRSVGPVDDQSRSGDVRDAEDGGQDLDSLQDPSSFLESSPPLGVD